MVAAQLPPQSNPLFEPYLKLMDFLEHVLGPTHEIVLHDLSKPAHSIIAIRNGHVSGRQVGGPTTDLALRIVRSEENSDRDCLLNYTSRSLKGEHLRSSTYLIRDEHRRVRGMLCVNIDDSAVKNLRAAVDQFLAVLPGQTSATRPNQSERGYPGATEPFPAYWDGPAESTLDDVTSIERLNTSIEELMQDAISDAVRAKKIDPARMTAAERRAIVSHLDQAGVFLLKDAVPKAAEAL
ncbi:MAG: PAS domain-containing protein, partial [Bifidobacteriaceae bacterium]|nr:PAS domain-containing protein [Bifidobacteriaceae bacterium]